MTRPFKPAEGDIFMMSFKNGDRSYLENVFRVLDRDDRITIAECISGFSSRERSFVFANAEVNFYETSPERAALLGVKTED